jgi:hypothetical protein
MGEMIMINTKHSIKYGVNDLGLASAIVCKGFEIIDLLPNPDSERVTFCFEPCADLDVIAKRYWSGKLTVDAKRFWQEMKNLKTRLYNIK